MTLAAALLFLTLQSAPAADAVDPALRAAVARFFELQEKEDVAGYLALWSPSGTPPRAEQLKYVFDNGDDKYLGPCHLARFDQRQPRARPARRQAGADVDDAAAGRQPHRHGLSDEHLAGV